MMKRASIFPLLLFALLFVGATEARAVETGFLKRSVTIGAKTYGYRVYIPENFDPKKKYPVVLYLHGSKHWGDDNEGQLQFTGLAPVIRAGLRLQPEPFTSFIGVFPQSSNETPWVGEMIDQAVKALDQTVIEFKADAERLYVTGFSLGGYGSWYAAAKYPGKFAAIVPVGGNISVPERFLPLIKRLVPPDMLELYLATDPHAAFLKATGQTPVWIFHGGEDGQVPVADARKTVEALKAAGRNVHYTEYYGDGHFVTEKAYTEPGFWKWLLAQKLQQQAASR